MKAFYPLNDFDINGIIRQNPKLSISTNSTKINEEMESSNVLNSETGNKCFYGTADVSYIILKFNDVWIYPTSYSIQAPDKPDCTNAGYYPKQWILYGKENNEWKFINEVSESMLNEKLKIIVYNIEKTKRAPYQEFKFESTELNYLNGHQFPLQAIDFWGTLCTSKTNCKELLRIKETCKHLTIKITPLVYILLGA